MISAATSAAALVDRNALSDAIMLGVVIEEIYRLFGEGIYTISGGLLDRDYEMHERAVAMTRDYLLGFGCDPSLVHAFDVTAWRVRRRGCLPRSGDLASQNLDTALSLSDIMHKIREQLGPHKGTLYDAGVMLARLQLCLRCTIEPPPDNGPWRLQHYALYTRELNRVYPITAKILTPVCDDPLLKERLDPRLRERLLRIAGHLEHFDSSTAWKSKCLTFIDALFAALGFIDNPLSLVTNSADGNDARAPGSQSQAETVIGHLLQQRTLLQQLQLEGDFALAETGQRRLLNDCRRTFGFGHPLTIRVRSDLCLSLLGLGRSQLACAMIQDLADDGERWHGPRWAGMEAAHAARVLLTLWTATRNFAECRHYIEVRLGWLRDGASEALDEALRPVQKELFDLMGGQRSHGS